MGTAVVIPFTNTAAAITTLLVSIKRLQGHKAIIYPMTYWDGTLDCYVLDVFNQSNYPHYSKDYQIRVGDKVRITPTKIEVINGKD